MHMISSTKKTEASDINNMKMWVFYLASKKWNVAPRQCYEIFENNGLFDCIEEGYDYLHLMSYKSVVDELEEVIKCRETDAI